MTQKTGQANKIEGAEMEKKIIEIHGKKFKVENGIEATLWEKNGKRIIFFNDKRVSRRNPHHALGSFNLQTGKMQLGIGLGKSWQLSGNAITHRVAGEIIKEEK